jgi:hypothetical protein
MNLGNKLKKVTILVLTAILFTTLFGFSGAKIEAQAATNEVSMYYVDRTNAYRTSNLDIYIKVKNIGFNKKVTVHYSAPSQSTQWFDVSATYFKTLADGSEIWKASVGLGMYNLFYAIKYEVNGSTYWDNNSGKNYADYQYVGVNPIKNERPYSYEVSDLSKYSINAIVKNIAYNKVIKVKYTQDNWVTSSEKSLNYSSSITGTDQETWKTTLNLDINKKANFKYFVYYQVNGQTYIDNNFGLNYNTSFCNNF